MCCVSFCNLQLPTGDPDLLQSKEDFLRHVLRQVHGAEVFKDFNASNLSTIDPGLICNGTDDISRLHLMCMADFDAEGFHVLVALARSPRSTIFTRSTIITEVPFRSKGVIAGPLIVSESAITGSTFITWTVGREAIPSLPTEPVISWSAFVAATRFKESFLLQFFLQQQRVTTVGHDGQRADDLLDRHLGILPAKLIDDRTHRIRQRMRHVLNNLAMES